MIVVIAGIVRLVMWLNTPDTGNVIGPFPPQEAQRLEQDCLKRTGVIASYCQCFRKKAEEYMTLNEMKQALEKQQLTRSYTDGRLYNAFIDCAPRQSQAVRPEGTPQSAAPGAGASDQIGSGLTPPGNQGQGNRAQGNPPGARQPGSAQPGFGAGGPLPGQMQGGQPGGRQGQASGQAPAPRPSIFDPVPQPQPQQR